MRFLTTFQLADFADTLVSLITAFVLGTLIGAERQYRQRTAGLRFVNRLGNDTFHVGHAEKG